MCNFRWSYIFHPQPQTETTERVGTICHAFCNRLSISVMWLFFQEVNIWSVEGGETLNSVYFIKDWWLLIPISYLSCWSKISGEYLECLSWSNMMICSVVQVYDLHNMPMFVHFNLNHFQITWYFFTIDCLILQYYSLFYFQERMGVLLLLPSIVFLRIPSSLPPSFSTQTKVVLRANRKHAISISWLFWPKMPLVV